MTAANKQPLYNIALGKAIIKPSKADAGSFITVNYIYRVDHPIDDTGFVKIVFRYAGDFGTPQFDFPQEPNYCSVSTNGDCRIESRWDPKGHTRPWGKALYLKVMGGFLDTGETITVVFGDKSQGCPGWKMQSFCEKTFEFKTLTDPFATYKFKEIPRSPTLRIIPGKPVKAVCITPSQVVQSEKFEYFIRLEDKWGNSIRKATKKTHPGFKQSGFLQIAHKDAKTGLKAISNPIKVVDKPVELSHFWADFHGQSEETIGSNSIEDYFSYARDCSKLDIAAHQANDFQITDALWQKINRTTKNYYKPGQFVTFPGYEWSGNTPLGGDRNIFYKNERGSIYRSSHDLLPGYTSTFPTAPTVDHLFERLDDSNAFVFAHVGGRYADIDVHKEGVEIAAEVHSAWGTFEWLIDDALNKRYRIGICANSDGHKGRPGASYPGASRFGSLGGLTCVLSKNLDRNSIFDAMKKRHFYATTGNRSLLDISIVSDDGRKFIMGDVAENIKAAPVLNIDTACTSPIDRIEVRNGPDVIQTIYPFTKNDLGSQIKIVWSGAKVKGRDRMVTWDGNLKIRNNKIGSFTPINFWNPDVQPQQISANELSWRSITTGGLAGLIIDLDKSYSGRMEITTAQKSCHCDIASVSMKPKNYKAGGLRKQIQMYRLPSASKSSTQFKTHLKLKTLHHGDNPVYVKVVLQDGHMLWSSPLFINKH